MCRATLDLLSVEWLASWSSVFESVEWNTSESIESESASYQLEGGGVNRRFLSKSSKRGSFEDKQ